MTNKDNGIARQTDHLFRRKYGETVAALVSLFGSVHFEIIEEAVQAAFQHALQKWPLAGSPQNPAGWIYSVARNQVLETIRKQQAENKRGQYFYASQPQACSNAVKQDDMVQMLLLCCNPDLSIKDQIYLTLKVACGFSIREIARATSKAEETVKKSITRAKQKINSIQEIFAEIRPQQIRLRFAALIVTMYALFNEGYAASSGEEQLRKDMAEEAIYLCDIFLKSRLTPSNFIPQLNALMALMLFHYARFDTRQGADNQPVLLQEQDRKKWNKGIITAAMQALRDSQNTDTFTSFHIEARIAAEHCCSPSFAETNWKKIIEMYDQLLLLKDTTEVRLNRIIALKYVYGNQRAQNELDSLSKSEIHSGALSYLIYALQAQLLEETDHPQQSKKFWKQALENAPTHTDVNFIKEKLKKI
jgi:RNA polymerase sigma factor (sigma-70 family)